MERRWQLAAVDILALLGFVVVGRLSHSMSVGPVSVMGAALPFLAGFLGAAIGFGVYRKRRESGRRAGVRLLAAWVVGVLAGLALRAWYLGQVLPESLFGVFALVALVFGGLFLFGFRGLFHFVGVLYGRSGVGRASEL